MNFLNKIDNINNYLSDNDIKNIEKQKIESAKLLFNCNNKELQNASLKNEIRKYIAENKVRILIRTRLSYELSDNYIVASDRETLYFKLGINKLHIIRIYFSIDDLKNKLIQ